MPWSAKEMLDSQHQRVDIPALARTAHNSLLQKRQNENRTELSAQVIGQEEKLIHCSILRSETLVIQSQNSLWTHHLTSSDGRKRPMIIIITIIIVITIISTAQVLKEMSMNNLLKGSIAMGTD